MITNANVNSTLLDVSQIVSLCSDTKVAMFRAYKTGVSSIGQNYATLTFSDCRGVHVQGFMFNINNLDKATKSFESLCGQPVVVEFESSFNGGSLSLKVMSVKPLVKEKIMEYTKMLSASFIDVDRNKEAIQLFLNDIDYKVDKDFIQYSRENLGDGEVFACAVDDSLLYGTVGAMSEAVRMLVEKDSNPTAVLCLLNVLKIYCKIMTELRNPIHVSLAHHNFISLASIEAAKIDSLVKNKSVAKEIQLEYHDFISMLTTGVQTYTPFTKYVWDLFTAIKDFMNLHYRVEYLNSVDSSVCRRG